MNEKSMPLEDIIYIVDEEIKLICLLNQITQRIKKEKND